MLKFLLCHVVVLLVLLFFKGCGTCGFGLGHSPCQHLLGCFGVIVAYPGWLGWGIMMWNFILFARSIQNRCYSCDRKRKNPLTCDIMLAVQGSISVEKIWKDRNRGQALTEGIHCKISNILSPGPFYGVNKFEIVLGLETRANLFTIFHQWPLSVNLNLTKN